MNDHIIISLPIYFYGSIFVLGIGLSQKPLDGRWWNMLENLNEAFILITGYFMLFFSEWVPDVFVRQEYGDVYVELLYGIIAVNVVVGLRDIAKALRQQYLRRMRDIKAANELRYKKTQIDIFLQESKVTTPGEIELNRNLLMLHHVRDIENKIREIQDGGKEGEEKIVNILELNGETEKKMLNDSEQLSPRFGYSEETDFTELPHFGGNA